MPPPGSGESGVRGHRDPVRVGSSFPAFHSSLHFPWAWGTLAKRPGHPLEWWVGKGSRRLPLGMGAVAALLERTGICEDSPAVARSGERWAGRSGAAGEGLLPPMAGQRWAA